MKVFPKHNDDCICQQCMNLEILEVLSKISAALSPVNTKSADVEKSAFQNLCEKHEIKYPSDDMRLFWDGAINAVLNLPPHNSLYDRSTKKIAKLKEL